MKRILIADDEPDILKIVKFRLINAGYEVIMAVNGQEALELSKKVMPDLILLDISMPVMKGDEACRQIKSDETLKHIPVILMTASTQDANEDTAGKLGAQGFILKPFEAEEFINEINKFIG